MVPLYTLKTSAFILLIFSGTWPIPKKSVLLHSAVLPRLPWSTTRRKVSPPEIVGSKTPAAGRMGKSSLTPTHSLPALEVRESAFCIVLQGDPSCWSFGFCFVFNVDDFSQCKQYIVKFFWWKGREGKWGLQCPLHIIFSMSSFPSVLLVMVKWRSLIFQRKNYINTTAGCSSLTFWYEMFYKKLAFTCKNKTFNLLLGVNKCLHYPRDQTACLMAYWTQHAIKIIQNDLKFTK